MTAIGAGLLSGIAAWQQEVSAEAEAQYYSGTLTTPEFPFVESNVLEAARRRNAMAVAAGAMAAGSVASFVVVGTQTQTSPTSARGRPVISMAPMPDGGVILGVAGRW